MVVEVKVTAEAARRFLVARHFLTPARSLEGGPEAVSTEPLVLLVNLGTKHIAIEGVRAFPIGHGDHAVVDNDARQHATDAARPGRSVASRRRAP